MFFRPPCEPGPVFLLEVPMKPLPATRLVLEQKLLEQLARTRTLDGVRALASRHADRVEFAEQAAQAVFTDAFYSVKNAHRADILVWALDAGATLETSVALQRNEGAGVFSMTPSKPVLVKMMDHHWTWPALDQWLASRSHAAPRPLWNLMMLTAAENGNEDALERMLHAHPRRSLPSGARGSLLHHLMSAHALDDALFEVFETVLRRTRVPNARNAAGQTPLHVLLEPNELDVFGLSSPLPAASAFRFVRALQAAGCSPWDKDAQGRTPFELARTTLPEVIHQWEAEQLDGSLPLSSPDSLKPRF